MASKVTTLPTPLGRIKIRPHRASDGNRVVEAMLECYPIRDWLWPFFRVIFLRCDGLTLFLGLLASVVFIITRSPFITIVAVAVPTLSAFLFLLNQFHRWPEKEPEMNDVHAFYSQPGRGFWVAVLEKGDDDDDDGPIVGAIGLRETATKDKAELIRLFVLKPYRKFGVAHALFNAVIDAARQLGNRRLFLMTSAAQADAHAFYRRQGFAVVNHRRIGIIPCLDFERDI